MTYPISSTFSTTSVRSILKHPARTIECRLIICKVLWSFQLQQLKEVIYCLISKINVCVNSSEQSNLVVEKVEDLQLLLVLSCLLNTGPRLQGCAYWAWKKKMTQHYINCELKLYLLMSLAKTLNVKYDLMSGFSMKLNLELCYWKQQNGLPSFNKKFSWLCMWNVLENRIKQQLNISVYTQVCHISHHRLSKVISKHLCSVDVWAKS